MGKWTLSDIQASLVVIVGIVTSIYFLRDKIKSQLLKVIQEAIQPLTDKVDELQTDIKRVDVQQTKNYLVRMLSDIERGQHFSGIEMKRFNDVYDYYTQTLHKNTYIKHKYDELHERGLV